MKSLIVWWLLSKYSAVKNLVPLKVTMNAYNFGVAVYKVVIIPYIKWNPCFHEDYCLNILQLQFRFQKPGFTSTKLWGSCLQMGHFSINELISITLWWLLPKYSIDKNFIIRKEGSQAYNFGVPFIKRSSPHKWKEFYTSTMTTV